MSKIKRLAARLGTIHARIILTGTVLVVVLVGCVLLAVTLLYTQFVAQNNEITNNSLEIIGASVDGRIDTFRRLILAIRSDGAISGALGDDTDLAAVTRSMSGLYAYGLQHRYLVTTDGRMLDPAYMGSAQQSADMLRLAGYREYLASGKEEHFSAPHQFPLTGPGGERISYFYRLRDREERYRAEGYALFIISISSLFDERVDLMRSHFDDFYVIDGEGRVIFSLRGNRADEETRLFAAQNYQRFTGGGSTSHMGNLYFGAGISTYPDWHMVGVVSGSQFNQSIRFTVLLVSLLGVAGIALVVLSSGSISRSISRPLLALNRSMAEFEQGRVPKKVDFTPASGEMAALVGGFNHMLDSINAYLAAIVSEQEQKKVAEVTALRYQLQSLQNQINPHFLYNTMNIISFMALEGKSDEIRSFNQSLIALLRATLSNTQDTVSVDYELALLDAYIHIMDYRYPGMFAVEVRADADVHDCLLPKLILQPLVENAMLHGLFPTGEIGHITVQVAAAGEAVRVTVSDDGVGMTPEQVKGALAPRRGFTGIGLTNVNDRLILCYGSASALTVDSERGAGTRVRFVVPRLPAGGDGGEGDMPDGGEGAWRDTKP